jgi:ADP-ribose pyrophosphatase YjhB (NUDIX family)
VVAAVITDDAGRLLLCQLNQGHVLWSLPGGRIRRNESPVHAAIRDVREETGTEIEIIDLVGLYHLTGDGCGAGLPDAVVHVFRARAQGEVALNAPGRISRLSWVDPDALPASLTATTRAAVADAVANVRGILRTVHRDKYQVPEADEQVPVGALA